MLPLDLQRILKIKEYCEDIAGIEEELATGRE